MRFVALIVSDDRSILFAVFHNSLLSTFKAVDQVYHCVKHKFYFSLSNLLWHSKDHARKVMNRRICQYFVSFDARSHFVSLTYIRLSLCFHAYYGTYFTFTMRLRWSIHTERNAPRYDL